jgi:hypothetical protein
VAIDLKRQAGLHFGIAAFHLRFFLDGLIGSENLISVFSTTTTKLCLDV